MDILVLFSSSLALGAGIGLNYPLDIHMSPDAGIEEAIDKAKDNEFLWFKDKDGNWQEIA